MAYSGSIIGGEIHSVVASTGKFQHCLEFLVLDVHLDHVISGSWYMCVCCLVDFPTRHSYSEVSLKC